jgi:deoxycytidylate deaminase
MDGVWQFYEEYSDHGWSIVGIYIEMSPCERCSSALANLVGDSVEIYYSFDYKTQKADWEAAAKKLCG